MSLRLETLSRARFSLAAALVSLVLSALGLLAGSWGIAQGVGLLSGAFTLLAGGQAWRTGSRRYEAAALLGLSIQMGMFLGSVAGSLPLQRFKPIQIAAIAGYLAILVAVVLARSGRFGPGRAALIGSAAALAIVVGDAALGLGAPASRIPARSDWPDSSVAHPRLGRIPRGSMTYRTYSRDDRGGYLLHSDLRARTWVLNVEPGSDANLELPPDNQELVRVAIRKGNRDTTWHVQLSQYRFAVERRLPYFITFRARADRPRKASVGFSRNHRPWTSLGLYQNLELTSEWQEFREVFVATATDSNSRIVFDLGGVGIPVDISDVTLRGPPSGQRVDPILSGPRYYIQYQRNALGCRDRDYPVPRPKGGVRILVLGDELTEGVGVHEKDTFSSVLEQELNGPGTAAPPSPGVEVINCGVSGYGTHEQRLFFELFGATYQPDFVLVTMGSNDDQFYWEARRRKLIEREPSRLAGLSSVLRKIEVSKDLIRTHDYHRSVDDLVALDQAARAQGARLIVAVFRGEGPAETVKQGLHGKGIPLLELEPMLPSDSNGVSPRGPSDRELHQTVAGELLRWFRRDILRYPADTTIAPRPRDDEPR